MIKTKVVDTLSGSENQVIKEHEEFGWELEGISSDNNVQFIEKTNSYELKQEKKLKLLFKRNDEILAIHPELDKLENDFYNLKVPNLNYVFEKQPDNYKDFVPSYTKRIKIITIIFLLLIFTLGVFISPLIPEYIGVLSKIYYLIVIICVVYIAFNVPKRNEYKKYKIKIEKYNEDIRIFNEEERSKYYNLMDEYHNNKNEILEKAKEILAKYYNKK